MAEANGHSQSDEAVNQVRRGWGVWCGNRCEGWFCLPAARQENVVQGIKVLLPLHICLRPSPNHHHHHHHVWPPCLPTCLPAFVCLISAALPCVLPHLRAGGTQRHCKLQTCSCALHLCSAPCAFLHLCPPPSQPQVAHLLPRLPTSSSHHCVAHSPPPYSLPAAACRPALPPAHQCPR